MENNETDKSRRAGVAITLSAILFFENKIAIVNNSMHVFKKKWSCFKNINFQSINID